MSKILTVNNIPFAYPTDQDDPGWGGQATDWASEVTDVLAQVIGPDDIIDTSANIVDAQVTFANVPALSFNIGSVQSAIVDYNIYRTSTGTPNGIAETGTLVLVYNQADASWSMGQGDVVGDAEVNLQITSLGQIQYTSSTLGAGHVGIMKFSAKAKTQV